jgi:hypothetical protein
LEWTENPVPGRERTFPAVDWKERGGKKVWGEILLPLKIGHSKKFAPRLCTKRALLIHVLLFRHKGHRRVLTFLLGTMISFSSK